MHGLFCLARIRPWNPSFLKQGFNRHRLIRSDRVPFLSRVPWAHPNKNLILNVHKANAEGLPCVPDL